MAAKGPYGEVVSTEAECTDCDISASDSSFDGLARGLADGTISRRRALRMIGGALVGGVLASIPGMAWAAKPAPCPSGKKCGKRCCPDASFVCSKGNCACPSGTTNCGGTCVNLTTFQTDPQNCGTCGNICPPGTACSSGECLSLCSGGQSCCCQCSYCQVDENGFCIPGAPGITQCIDPQTTEISSLQCFNLCPSAPPGYALQGASGACVPAGSNYQYVCVPCTDTSSEGDCGGNQGTRCEPVPCASGA